LLGLYYFRWTGTSEEFEEYFGRSREIADGIEGADLKGVFLPTSEWNYVALVEATSFDKIMDIYKTYLKKYGAHPKIPLAKLELLLTFEELGYTT
jgi:hypothetical protein